MANKSLFASLTNRLPRANAVNEAGGRAYKLEPTHALAQVAANHATIRKNSIGSRRFADSLKNMCGNNPVDWAAEMLADS